MIVSIIHSSVEVPLFEGEATEAHKALVPGVYYAVTAEGDEVYVVVTETSSKVEE